jgi:nucleoside-diphosphate-sugar epimerase
MRVTVFGATGRIGHLVVERLLAGGHEVHALVRAPAKITLTHPKLTVTAGPLSDGGLVGEAVAGSDAVISALGPPLRRGQVGTPLTDGTRAIVAAMDARGVRRFVGLATPSVPDPRDRPTLRGKIIPLLAKTMFPGALAEVIGMTAAVRESDLDWTIARITSPRRHRARGTVRAGYLGRDSVGSAMTRADIATFLVGQLSDTTYLRAAPAISN